VSSGLLVQVGYLARRSVIRTLRQPAAVFFPLAFPVLLLAVNSGGLEAETKLPGFPTDSFLAFALAVPFIQGGLFATGNAGIDVAKDIQTGFLNRLALTPMRGIALLLGELGGVMALALIQAAFYLVIGLVFGVRFESGIGGGFVMIALAAVIALGFAAFGAFAALRTGSTEAVNGIFPVFFVFLFISSMNIPRNLMSTDWFRWFATANPVSYLIEGMRSLIITGWDAQALGLAFGVGLAAVVVGFALAAAALPERMART
jgi:ABC-2 type transport system permease protein